MHETQRRIAEFLFSDRFAQVVTFGSEMAMRARRDPSYREAINAADLVVPDTIGIVYAARMLGESLRERVAGVELAERICGLCAQKGVSVFLIGGEPAVAERAAAELVGRYPGLRIVGTQPGYFNEEEEAGVIARIRASAARLVLVGLGFPRQEFWIQNRRSQLGPVVCIGVGGTLDVLSGKLSRAPRAMRELGLEWLYRLVREPKRLRRQLVLPVFAALVTAQALRQRFKRT